MMDTPDEIPIIRVEEHLKISVVERTETANAVIESEKIVISKRV